MMVLVKAYCVNESSPMLSFEPRDNIIDFVFPSVCQFKLLAQIKSKFAADSSLFMIVFYI